MDMESIPITMAQNSLVIGSSISNKDMERSNGQMVLNMKEIIKRV